MQTIMSDDFPMGTLVLHSIRTMDDVNRRDGETEGDVSADAENMIKDEC